MKESNKVRFRGEQKNKERAKSLYKKQKRKLDEEFEEDLNEYYNGQK